MDMALDPAAINALRLEATRAVHSDALLFSLQTALPTQLYGKPAFWIPRAVSDNPGGRESLYDLQLNEQVLLGIYVINTLQIVRELVTRIGDTRYSMSLQTRGGKEIFAGEGDLEVINSQAGHGRIPLHRPTDRRWASAVWHRSRTTE
jgi:hypothetical protein